MRDFKIMAEIATYEVKLRRLQEQLAQMSMEAGRDEAVEHSELYDVVADSLGVAVVSLHLAGEMMACGGGLADPLEVK